MSVKRLIPLSVKRKVHLVKNFGFRNRCPFCGYSSNSWLPTGQHFKVLSDYEVIGAGRRASICHNCGSKSRERHIFLYFRDVLKIFKNPAMSLLHVAPETLLGTELAKVGFERYVCGDYFTPGYKYPEHVINMDVREIAFDDETFDIVICNHVLEHVKEDETGMAEIFRVLKKGGKAILLVPYSPMLERSIEDDAFNTDQLRAENYGQRDHVRLYGVDYFERLENVGFGVERINLKDKYPKAGIDEEDLIVCTKN